MFTHTSSVVLEQYGESIDNAIRWLKKSPSYSNPRGVWGPIKLLRESLGVYELCAPRHEGGSMGGGGGGESK